MIGGGTIVIKVNTNEQIKKIIEIDICGGDGKPIRNESIRSPNERLEIYIVRHLLEEWTKEIQNDNNKGIYLDWFLRNACRSDIEIKSRTEEHYTVSSEFFKDPSIIIQLLTIMYFFARISSLSMIPIPHKFDN